MISSDCAKDLTSLVLRLGEAAEEIKSKKFLVSKKTDDSPLTEADLLINSELNAFLGTTPYKNIISEENNTIPYATRSDWKYFWLIDPIDGTKEYINKGTDYTINVALCKNKCPIFSIVYAPARNELFHAETGKGSYKNGEIISISKNISLKINAVASKSHMNDLTHKYLNALMEEYSLNVINFGSSLKICKIADGTADIYPRFGPTMEWDTCAADLILTEAGGNILNTDGTRLEYNKENLLNPYFVALSDKKLFLTI